MAPEAPAGGGSGCPPGPRTAPTALLPRPPGSSTLGGLHPPTAPPCSGGGQAVAGAGRVPGGGRGPGSAGGRAAAGAPGNGFITFFPPNLGL